MHRIFIPITRRVLSLFLDIISLTLFKSDDEQRTMIIRKLLKKKKKMGYFKLQQQWAL